jgi:hypothetical protein
MPTRPYGAVITDYDLDGDNDLIVGCSAISSSDIDSIVIMFNDGWGNFEIEGFEANSGIFIYCEDLTGDGYPDIVSRDVDSIFFHKNDQNGGLGDEYKICHTIGNRRIAGIADMDTNGYLDIVYYGYQLIGGWGIAYNMDGFTFYDDYLYYADDFVDVTIGLINDDQLTDVFVARRSLPEKAYIMFNKIETFKYQKISGRYWTFAHIFDVDNNSVGEPVTEFLSSNYYINSQLFFFDKNDDDEYYIKDSANLHGASRIKAIDDFDQDGYPDVALTISSWESHPSEDSIYIYRNNQNWGYEFYDRHYIGGWFYPSIVSGDLNMDGYPDLVTIGYQNPNPDYIQLLWNDGTGHFIDTNSVYVQQNEILYKHQIKIFPNPASDNLSITSTSEKIKEVKILDLNGRILFREKFSSTQNRVELNLNILSIKHGVYLCVVQLENESFIFKKLIVKI